MDYIFQDIYMTPEGDLDISAAGDIKLADSFETVKQIVTFIVKTDKGELATNNNIGADLGAFYGTQLSKNILTSMEKSIFFNLQNYVLSPSDFEVHCIPVEHDTVGVFVVVGGTYLDIDGKELEAGSEVLQFVFPYGEGSPTLL